MIRLKKIRKSVLLSCIVLILFALTICGCGGDQPGAAPDVDLDEILAMQQNNLSKYTLNGKTDELLDDFEYLFTEIHNDDAAIQAQSYDDIVTVLVEEYGNDMQCLWIYDAKRDAVFFDIGPYRANMLCDYQNAYELSDTDKENLIDTIKIADPHKWDERYPGEDIGTGSYSWAIVIEYKGGVLEIHSGCGSTIKSPEGFTAIKSLLYSYSYGDNPLYEDGEPIGILPQIRTQGN